MIDIDLVARKLGAGRAGADERRSRMALAEPEACHALATCVLAAVAGLTATAHVRAGSPEGCACNVDRSERRS